jgi:hypothetical protein
VDIDNPYDVDNIGFYLAALENFDLLGFDIHGALDPAGSVRRRARSMPPTASSRCDTR